MYAYLAEIAALDHLEYKHFVNAVSKAWDKRAQVMREIDWEYGVINYILKERG